MKIQLTKNQSLLLSVFFAHPGKSFYLRELSRLLHKEPGVFQKDINKLVDGGLLTSSYQGKSRFFSLNKDYPLYKEIRSIIQKTTGFFIPDIVT